MGAIANERFWKKVSSARAPDECWIWIASKDPNGYGCHWHNGRLVKAHRVSWELAHGIIPDGLCILHKCDNPSCVNPAHLFLGTKTDNMRDKEDKGRGRHATGERHGKSRFNWGQIENIRNEYDATRHLPNGHPSKATHIRLAKKYATSYGHIGMIVRGDIWKPMSTSGGE